MYTFIIIVIIALYIYSYYLHPSTVQILQTRTDMFTSTMLLDKQPLVVEDSDPSFTDRLLSEFRISEKCSPPVIDQWHKNNFKYIVIQARDKVDVLACPATVKRGDDSAPVNDSAIIAFRLRQGQAVILPFHWSFYVSTEDCVDVSGIHDFVTYLLPSA